MIVVGDVHPSLQQGQQRLAIGIHAQIEHGHRIAGLSMNPLQQRDVALGAGNKHRFDGLCQPQLMQCAESVGIAVEYINMSHPQRFTMNGD